MTQLAAEFAAKGLLNLMKSSPVATGLAHKYSSLDFINFLLGERYSVVYNYLPEWRILHELICGFRSVKAVVFAVTTS